jgi:hypothetical protein
LAPKGANIRFFADDNPRVLYVRYAPDNRSKIRQQRFVVGRQPVRYRDLKAIVLTANRIEYIGSAKAPDWNDALNGPRANSSITRSIMPR